MKIQRRGRHQKIIEPENPYSYFFIEERERMKIDTAHIKSQKLFVVFIIFGFIWSLDLRTALREGPASDGFTLGHAFGKLLKLDMRVALGEEEKAATPGEIDLGQEFINAFETNNESKMKSLVKENKNSVSKEVMNMITYATSGEVTPDEMTWLVKISSKMATLYGAEFSDKRMESFVENYKKWSKTEQEKRKKADGVFYSYKKDMKSKNYDAVVEKWDQSLEMYREIGDKLCETKRLNEIGITFGKLGSYKTSIKFLNDARDLNKEIGNVAGEISDLRYIAAGYMAFEDYNNAIETYKSALNIAGDIGDKGQQDMLLTDIAGVEEKIKNMKADAK